MSDNAKGATGTPEAPASAVEERRRVGVPYQIHFDKSCR